MDLERLRIAGRELARLRDPRARLPNATEWAAAVNIIEALDRHDRAEASIPCHATEGARGHGPAVARPRGR